MRDILVRNVRRTTALVTDEAPHYWETGEEYASHETVKHSGLGSEWVNKNGYTTNNVENFFGVFKRGFKVLTHIAKNSICSVT